MIFVFIFLPMSRKIYFRPKHRKKGWKVINVDTNITICQLKDIIMRTMGKKKARENNKQQRKNLKRNFDVELYSFHGEYIDGIYKIKTTPLNSNDLIYLNIHVITKRIPVKATYRFFC